MAVNFFEQAAQIEQLGLEIGARLYGRGPAVQSAVIADLLSKYLTGWPSAARDAQLKAILGLASELMGPNENIALALAEPANESAC